jgi:hypothetical protein
MSAPSTYRSSAFLRRPVNPSMIEHMFEAGVGVESFEEDDWPPPFDDAPDFTVLLEELPPEALGVFAPMDEAWVNAVAEEGGGEEFCVARMRPSGWLTLDLEERTGDPEKLSDADLVDSIIAWDRVVAWAGARQAAMLAEFAERRPDTSPKNPQHAEFVLDRFAADEIGLALLLSRGTAQVRLCQARRLGMELAATRQLWEDGLVEDRKVRAICDATEHLSPEVATAVQNRVLDRAPHLTLAQLRAALVRAVIAVDPEGANERHRQARKDRRVALNAEQDGMSSLWALLSAPDALSAYQWLTSLARGLGSDDARGMDARRADLLVALLTGQLTYARTTDDSTEQGEQAGQVGQVGQVGQPEGQAEPAGAQATETPSGSTSKDAAANAGGGAATPPPTVWSGPPPRPVNPSKPLVQVVMAHSTLIGADNQPCELVGYGPVPADLAREIAADAVWRRLITDPLSGTLLDYGEKVYKPPAGLANFVRARDGYCRSPICRRRALDAELDHVVPWPKGPTCEPNLASGCTHDHHCKHAPGWQVIARPGGLIEWITPTGHRYASEPFDYRPEPPPMRVLDPDPDGEPAPRRRVATRPRVDPFAASATWDAADLGVDPPPF